MGRGRAADDRYEDTGGPGQPAGLSQPAPPAPWSSMAFRLALNYGALVLITMIAVLGIFYLQTVGVLQQRIDSRLSLVLDRLVEDTAGERDALVSRIEHALASGENADAEIYLLVDALGAKVIGNIPLPLPAIRGEMGTTETEVVRNGQSTIARLHTHRFPNGNVLVVGASLRQQREIERLFTRASLAAALITVLMTVVGAFAFRQEVDERAGEIRRTVARVAAGDLGQRIPVSARQDEFARLDRDINAMLDRLEQSMDGVRHVSNTIAHNLRTPLTRILLHLRSAERAGPQQQSEALRFAARELAELGAVFDKLLHIAEVESGTRRQGFAPVAMNALTADVLELYEPLAEERRARLTFSSSGDPVAAGDPDLLASAVANLVDNALKYTSTDGQARITVRAARRDDKVEVSVRDNGIGVAAEDLSRIGTRFYRTDRSRPGYGLGLASVQAIVRMHGGELRFADARPGLEVRIVLPAAL